MALDMAALVGTVDVSTVVAAIIAVSVIQIAVQVVQLAIRVLHDMTCTNPSYDDPTAFSSDAWGGYTYGDYVRDNTAAGLEVLPRAEYAALGGDGPMDGGYESDADVFGQLAALEADAKQERYDRIVSEMDSGQEISTADHEWVFSDDAASARDRETAACVESDALDAGAKWRDEH